MILVCLPVVSGSIPHPYPVGYREPAGERMSDTRVDKRSASRGFPGGYREVVLC